MCDVSAQGCCFAASLNSLYFFFSDSEIPVMYRSEEVKNWTQPNTVDH